MATLRSQIISGTKLDSISNNQHVVHWVGKCLCCCSRIYFIFVALSSLIYVACNVLNMPPSLDIPVFSSIKHTQDVKKSSKLIRHLCGTKYCPFLQSSKRSVRKASSTHVIELICTSCKKLAVSPHNNSFQPSES